LLVNDIQEIRNIEMSPQSQSLWMQIKQSCVVRAVFASLNPEISLREEVGFNNNSDVVNTHNPNTQGGIKLCMCM